ncbi:MAG: thiamine-phosphate kinase [Candidatus Omnitrophica bacterium]|nr:thiamine-phosphate kinase [Candidatus Omnitrophota bacterium]
MKELELINYIAKKAGKCGKPVKLGIGDDCAVIDYDNKHYLLWASDMITDGTHFKLKNADLKSIGWKSVAVNISDIAAMGGEPKFVIISIGIPKGMKLADVRRIYDGIFAVCEKFNVKVIGGDTVRAKSLVIDVSIMGFVEKKKLIKRQGAKKGDLVLVTGPVRDGKKNHLDFLPRMKESRFLAGNFKINCMIDVSDGIAVDLGRICEMNKLGCRLYEDAVPLSKDLSVKDALYYGESFELLFTMSMKEAKRLFTSKKIKSFGPAFYIIGEIVGREKGRTIVGKEGRVQRLCMKGFEHL